MQENYLAKWLNNELSEEELAAFKKSAEYASYLKISELSQKLEAPDFNVDSAWNTFNERKEIPETKVVPLRPYRQFLRIAAVIAVMLGGAYFYLSTLGTQYTAGLAQQTTFNLPDASQVVLNAGSELAFNETDWDSNRNVNLKGEAFFKVAKGKTFTVETEAGTVQVLGTEFNVESREDFFEVTCFEGLVSVTYNGISKKLPAGHSFVVVNGKVTETSDVVAVAPSWTKKESSFKSIPLRFVFEELERQFDIRVTTKNVDTELLFTGTFNNRDLNLALESISTPSQIRYKLEEDKVLFYAEDTP